MKCAILREHNAEGGCLEDPTGGHFNTPHTSPDRDMEGQDEDGELSRREEFITYFEKFLPITSRGVLDRTRNMLVVRRNWICGELLGVHATVCRNSGI